MKTRELVTREFGWSNIVALAISAAVAVGFFALIVKWNPVEPISAHAQSIAPGLPLVPMGFCQMTASGSAANLDSTSCVSASFTATAVGTALTASSVTGDIHVGSIISGTHIPTGTRIVAQVSGTAGGAGVYTTSVATTASADSITAGGVPLGSTLGVIVVETANIRWRDDGAAPTTSVGMLIPSASAPYSYAGTLSAVQIIAVSGSPVVDVAFYKSP